MSTARLGFWAAGAAATVIVGFGVVLSQSDGGGTDRQENSLEDTTPTTQRQLASTTSTMDMPLEESVDFAALVGATGQLESYQLTMVQETTSYTMRNDVVQVGLDSSSSMELGERTATSLLVDGRSYELEGETWYLKPTPARALVTTTLSDFTDSLRDLPASEISRTRNTVVLRITCGSDERSQANETVKLFCDDRTTTTAVIDLETGLLASVRIEGELETYPGTYQKGFVEIHVMAIDPLEPLEAPVAIDVTRSDCIGAELGTLDYAEMGDLLDANTTDENRFLFNGCGFDIFPPGRDFQSTD